MEVFENNHNLIEEKKNEINEMHDALTFIADEIKRFEASEKICVVKSKSSSQSKNKFNDNYKFKLKNKIQLITKLRKDLKAACLVAKTLLTVKQRETTALTSQVIYARSECLDLLKRYNNNIDIIDNLHKENVSLHDKMENLAKFIHLGYEELQIIQNEKSEELSTAAQLKQLIEWCGQYYADYCNEIKASQQIKQRNRFLKSKINILENTIAAVKEQLKALEYRYLRLQTENNQMRAKNVRSLNFKIAYSEVKMKASIEQESSTNEKHYPDSGDSLAEQTKNLDLSTHLEIVKRLLSDQDTLLKDLTIISKEVSIV